jgi:hypothetical protein
MRGRRLIIPHSNNAILLCSDPTMRGRRHDLLLLFLRQHCVFRPDHEGTATAESKLSWSRPIEQFRPDHEGTATPALVFRARLNTSSDPTMRGRRLASTSQSPHPIIGFRPDHEGTATSATICPRSSLIARSDPTMRGRRPAIAEAMSSKCCLFRPDHEGTATYYSTQ